MNVVVGSDDWGSKTETPHALCTHVYVITVRFKQCWTILSKKCACDDYYWRRSD